MTSFRPLHLAALVVVAAFATSCSDSPTGPVVREAPALDQVLAELQPASLAPLASQISAASVTGLGAPNPASCTYASATHSFVCPDVAITGITVSRSFTLLDAGGSPMSQYDRAATAAVRMTSSFAGTVTSGASTVTVDQTQDVTLSGLLTGVHTLNGTSLGHLAGTIGNGTTTTAIASTISTTITNLVLPQSSTGPDRFPKSGVIAVANTTSIGALPAFATNVSITFNGTSKASVVVTAGGATTSCTVDLSAQTATFCTL
jgi:hypothetical protein